MATTYTFTLVPTWGAVGSLVRRGTGGTHVGTVTDPGGASVTVVQGGVTQAGYLLPDPSGTISFTTTDVPTVLVDFGAGPVTVNATNAVTANMTAAANAASSAASASSSASSAAASAALVGAPAGAAIDARLGGDSTNFIVKAEGRYRRVLSELRSLSAGADIRSTVRSAILAASGTSAAELVLPEGTWTVGSAEDSAASLLIDVPNVILRGAGRGKTKLVSAINRNVIEARGTSGSPISGVEIRDMTITGAGSASTAHGNQTLVALNYTRDARIAGVVAGESGLNSFTAFYSDGLIAQDVEAYDPRAFGFLVYRSDAVKVIDLYAHDMTATTGSHLGLQFKSSNRCTSTRLRAKNIAGYGFYVWDDGLDTTNYLDRGHQLIDPTITDLIAGGTFAAQAVFINATQKFTMRGGRVATPSAGNGVVVTSSTEVVIDGVSNIQSLGPAVSIGGTSSFRVRGVTANGEGVANSIGIDVTGTPVFGSIRDCAFINGAAGGSVDNAACRLASTVTGVFVEHNDFSDYQATKTQRRGMYDRTAAGVNYWRHNKASGNTVANKTIPAGSEDTGNV